MEKIAGDRATRSANARPQATETPNMSDSTAVALYIAGLSEELSRLARSSGLSTLSYILDMARLEAREAANAKDSAGEGRVEAKDAGCGAMTP
ncbi:hypothetical protein V5F69_15905 [Xanthobacter sp. V2C-4]|uniref:hypothetical protein n=1 Tax=Xanthobacter albus TaxID=3119929 RepID=UPI00372B8F25